MKRYLLTISMILAGLVVASGQEYILEERLLDAAYRGDTEIVKMLHKQGAIINYQNKNGRTALYLASHNGHIEIVKALIDAGADVNVQDNNSWTALIAAASRYGRKDTVKALIEAGATA